MTRDEIRLARELYIARIQERLDRLDEDAEYARLRERADAPYNWALLVELYSPAPMVWWNPHTVAHLGSGETPAQGGDVEAAIPSRPPSLATDSPHLHSVHVDRLEAS